MPARGKSLPNDSLGVTYGALTVRDRSVVFLSNHRLDFQLWGHCKFAHIFFLFFFCMILFCLFSRKMMLSIIYFYNIFVLTQTLFCDFHDPIYSCHCFFVFIYIVYQRWHCLRFLGSNVIYISNTKLAI